MSAVLSLLNYVWVGVVFVTMISVLVAAHELGHYLFARLFNMGVEEFAIGFGKNPLVVWGKRFYRLPLLEGQNPGIEAAPAKFDASTGGLSALEGRAQAGRIEVIQETDGRTTLHERTDFTVRPWPLGGFVRIKGMMPEEDGSETKIAGGFYSKAPWQRFIVLFAGPLFSVLAGIAILVPLFMVHGVRKPSTEPVLSTLTKEGAGYKGGLRVGDRVVAVNGAKVSSFYDMVRIVREQGEKATKFEVQRDGKPLTLSVTPSLDPKPTPVLDAEMEPTDETRRQGRIEAGPAFALVRLGFGEALGEAVVLPGRAVQGLFRIFTKPAQIKDNLGGPGTMIQATSQAVENGVPAILMLSAILSISVGIFNLLPAPPLDGGQMAIAVAEMFRGGRRLSMRVQVIVGTAGTLFVFGLILTALAVDFQRIALDRKPNPAVSQSK
jgi:regulator of sigma E protease